MADENQKPEVPPDDLDFTKKNGADIDDDDHDLFKSAMESPMTDTDRTLHGDDEIDLNDDDDDFDTSSSPSGMVDLPQSSILPSEETTTTENFTNHVKSHAPFSSSNGGGGGELNSPDQTEPYRKPEVNNEVGNSLSGGVGGATRSDVIDNHADDDHSGSGDPNQFLEVTVTDPQKQGDGISSFLVYRVTTRTNIALFRRKEFAVWRRFSDFLGLHSKLADKYLKKGRIVPPAPEKNVIGTTKIKIGTPAESPSSANGPNQGGEFVEKRRNGLERFLNRVAVHPILRIDPDFRDFLEIDSDLPKSTSTSALSGAGVARFFSKVGETMSKISYKMDEADPWFEEKIQNIEALENQLRKVHNSVDLLVANRKDLAHSTGAFAKSAAILSNAEEHTGLARALAQLADVEDKVEQMHTEQANLDFFMFSELLRDYVSLIGAVKEVFHERVKAYQGWQHAQQTLNKKRETKAKLELQVRNDKIAQAREEVVEWEGKVERTQEEFESISKVIKKELETFEAARVKDFKKTIVKYLESLLSHQQELVKYWEAFLPEAKAVA